MKKIRTLLALALTLCGTIAVFPVNAHAEEVDTQTVTANSVEKMANPARVRHEVILLDEYDIRSGIRLNDHLLDAKGRITFSTDSLFAQIHGSTLKIDRSIHDYESFSDGSNEIIVKCMVPAQKYYDEKELTLRFVVERSAPKSDYSGDMVDDEDGSEGGLTERGTIINVHKPSLAELSGMKSNTILINAANGISVEPVLAEPRIVNIPADNSLSARYGNTDEYRITRIETPFLNTEAGKISINCENTNVINLLGNNICDSIIGSSVSRIYVYPINEKGYEALAKGS
jgi:hypothetical protein